MKPDLADLLIIGAGKTGASVARWGLERGVKVTVFDDNVGAYARLSKAGASDSHFVSDGRDIDLSTITTCIKSPGIRRDHPLVQRCVGHQIPILSDLDIFAMFCECRVIAVTGTNGKTTTTTLIAHLLTKAGRKVFAGGNVGTPALEMLEMPTTPDFAVLELSSFQLATTSLLFPQYSIWTNFAPDHLDWHENISDYFSAKSRIFRTSSPGMSIIPGFDEAILHASMKSGRNTKTFGYHVRDDAMIMDSRVYLRDQGQHIKIQGNALVGKHNCENAAASLLVLELCGEDLSAFAQQAIDTFPGVPHRLQFVGESREVRFYNDSKATNVAATMVALGSFSEPIVWIAGGKPKGDDYSLLLNLVRKHVCNAIFFGQSKHLLMDQLSSATSCQVVDTLGEAFMLACQCASPGSVVLLSPACASFDQFKNFEDRGAQFQEYFRSLERGS